MLLAGIAITALAGAVGSLLEFYADNAMLRRISLWKMGGLDGANYPRLLLAAVVSSALLIALPRYAGTLNALLLGESEARHLGIDVGNAKIALIACLATIIGTTLFAIAGQAELDLRHALRDIDGAEKDAGTIRVDRRLLPQGEWDPDEEYWGEEEAPPAWAEAPARVLRPSSLRSPGSSAL